MNRLAFLFALGFAAPASCQACAAVTSTSDTAVRMTTESALIVWDAKSGREDFVRTANFHSETENFGFLVPTPTRPQLASANEGIFNDIEREMSPKTKTIIQRGINWTPFALSLFAGLSQSHDDGEEAETNVAASASNRAASIEVVEQKRVGDYNASVLRASDTESLAKWLLSHHYAVSPDTREWLAPYMKAGFFLTAFHIVSDLKDQSARTAAIRLSFQSETPFYPYRETRRAQKLVESRNLRLFYVGQERVEGRIENQGQSQPWPAQMAYSGNMDTVRLRSYGLDAPSGTMRLTVLTDNSSPRPGWGDLRFYPASDQSEVVPPPRIAYNDKRWWMPLDLLAFAAVLIVNYGGRLRRRGSIQA